MQFSHFTGIFLLYVTLLWSSLHYRNMHCNKKDTYLHKHISTHRMYLHQSHMSWKKQMPHSRGLLEEMLMKEKEEKGLDRKSLKAQFRYEIISARTIESPQTHCLLAGSFTKQERTATRTPSVFSHWLAGATGRQGLSTLWRGSLRLSANCIPHSRFSWKRSEWHNPVVSSKLIYSLPHHTPTLLSKLENSLAQRLSITATLKSW